MDQTDLPTQKKFQTIFLKITELWIRFVSYAKTHKYVTGSIIAFVGLSLFFIIPALVNSTTNKLLLYQHEQQKQLLEKQRKEAYEKLIKEQEKKNTQYNFDNPQIKKAIGKNKLHFIFVYPTTLKKELIEPLINKLTDKNNQINFGSSSLNYIKTFYKSEAKKYDSKDFNLEFSFSGPFQVSDLEKIGDVGYIWEKDPFGTTKLEDTFNKILKDNNVSVEKEDLVVFLYFDDSIDNNSINKERFYESKKFRSFANDKTGKSFINVYDFSPSFSTTLTEIAAHEILHLFGATDKYEESSSVTRVCSKRGWGDTEKEPSIPQEKADIMCMYVEKENDEFIRGKFIDNNLVINKFTAAEISWVKD